MGQNHDIWHIYCVQSVEYPIKFLTEVCPFSDFGILCSEAIL